MIIQVTARHFHASDELKENVTNRLKDLTRYHENLISGHIILDAEDKNRRSAEIILSTKHKHFTATGEGDNMGKAIEEAFDRAERQLIKFSEKLKAHHKDKSLKENFDSNDQSDNKEE